MTYLYYTVYFRNTGIDCPTKRQLHQVNTVKYWTGRIATCIRQQRKTWRRGTVQWDCAGTRLQVLVSEQP